MERHRAPHRRQNSYIGIDPLTPAAGLVMETEMTTLTDVSNAQPGEKATDMRQGTNHNDHNSSGGQNAGSLNMVQFSPLGCCQLVEIDDYEMTQASWTDASLATAECTQQCGVTLPSRNQQQWKFSGQAPHQEPHKRQHSHQVSNSSSAATGLCLDNQLKPLSRMPSTRVSQP